MGSVLSSLMSGSSESVGKGMETSQVTCYDSSENFRDYLLKSKQSSKLIVVDFSASWCGTCQLMAPKFRNMANKTPDVEFIRIDIDELSDVAQEFGIQVMPTFVLLKEGKEVKRLIGAKMDELESLISMYSPAAVSY